MASLSPDLFANIRQRIRWAAAVRGVRLAEDAVEDLAQDRLLRLWERERDSPDEVRNLPAYALRAASNLTVDELRRRRTKKREEPPSATSDEGAVLGAPWPPTPEQIAIGRDSLRYQLAECRRLLSARQYQMFALVYLAGFSPREVGQRLGTGPGNVHALLASLRQALARAWFSMLGCRGASGRPETGFSPTPRNPRDFRASLVDHPARSPVATGLMNKARRKSPPQPRPGGRP